MRRCIIHYAATNLAPDPKWRERPGLLAIQARGDGPHNCLVITDVGSVVVPKGNVKFKGAVIR